MKRTSSVLLLACITAFLAGTGPALATLGQKYDSVARDRRALAATQKSVSKTAAYTIQELSLESTTVREYINASGIVFAIAWNGMIHPDFDTILGAYANEYWTAKRAAERRHGRKSLRIVTQRMVVETWGHMRDLQGRAYLPAMLPEGVNIDEIR
ncbi:hypothetical protein GMST_22820 [Geomonas silvestris]|uniref:DUF2844 domain-containing protein n=1 Tax=Geomonas silvestris TaxID=2740184 RepID=A0A6V8MJ25_9BACT|nr:DUF2844 domain-containing protein [Geomonas silvestris]GFO59957.1 hypothetical protein GMST_22820 [Geomonas silvestris]